MDAMPPPDHITSQPSSPASSSNFPSALPIFTTEVLVSSLHRSLRKERDGPIHSVSPERQCLLKHGCIGNKHKQLSLWKVHINPPNVSSMPWARGCLGNCHKFSQLGMTSLEGDLSTIRPHCIQTQKPKSEEGKRLAQGHRVGECQMGNESPGFHIRGSATCPHGSQLSPASNATQPNPVSL